MGLLLLLGLFALCVVIGVPVAFALAVAAIATFAYEGLPLLIGFKRIVSGVSVFSLLAIPFFIFAGELMLRGGIAARLINLAAAAVGWVRGGLGMVNVFSSMLFGGISGSAVADVSALGSLLIPVMKKKGFSADYAVNVTVTSSIAGIMIPPSHNMILYVVAAGGGISVTKMFLAGVVPGVLMCCCLAVAAYWVARRNGYPSEAFPGLAALFVAFDRRHSRTVHRRHHRRRRAVRRLHRHRVGRHRCHLRFSDHHLRLPRAVLRTSARPCGSRCGPPRW
jgi:tripartite ATP-independent transporter DctM subunit